MSIQTTVEITKEQAFEKFYAIKVQSYVDEIREQFEIMSDEEIEDYIDEHFYNYRIV